MRVDNPPRSKSESPLADIIEGFRWVSHTGPIRALLLLLGLVSLVGMPYTVLMPIFADHVLHSGAKGLGILMGFTGIGALLGALTLAVRSGVRGLGRLISICCAGFGVSLIAFSFSKFVLAVRFPAPFRWDFSSCCRWPRSNTLIQAMVPDALRGRVMALDPLCSWAWRPSVRLTGRRGCGPDGCSDRSRSWRGSQHCGICLVRQEASSLPRRGPPTAHRAGHGWRRARGRDDRAGRAVMKC